MFELDPMAALLEAARALLVAAGLSRCETGGTVYYASELSSKPVLVLLHGVNDHAGTWAQAIGPLSQRYRLIVPDLPGHGESGPHEGPVSLPLIVERIDAIVTKENLGTFSLAGNSMGAWISILYTLEHPERVKRLFLESGGGLAIAPSVPLSASTQEEAERILVAVHGPEFVMSGAATNGFIRRSATLPVHRVLASGVLPYFVDARLGEIKVPTTLIWGENDGVISRSYMDKLQRGIVASRFCEIKQAAHLPHAQQPERFVECLTANW